MRLTKQNAYRYVGKQLYLNRLLAGPYPYTVKLTNVGTLVCFDNVGNVVAIPGEHDWQHIIFFDYVKAADGPDFYIDDYGGVRKETKEEKMDEITREDAVSWVQGVLRCLGSGGEGCAFVVTVQDTGLLKAISDALMEPRTSSADDTHQSRDWDSVYVQCIKTYGAQAQEDVAIEEMSELTKAILKMRREKQKDAMSPKAMDNLIDEIADVRIMCRQLEMIYNIDMAVEKRIDYKTARQKQRLADKEQEDRTK